MYIIYIPYIYYFLNIGNISKSISTFSCNPKYKPTMRCLHAGNSVLITITSPFFCTLSENGAPPFATAVTRLESNPPWIHSIQQKQKYLFKHLANGQAQNTWKPLGAPTVLHSLNLLDPFHRVLFFYSDVRVAVGFGLSLSSVTGVWACCVVGKKIITNVTFYFVFGRIWFYPIVDRIKTRKFGGEWECVYVVISKPI